MTGNKRYEYWEDSDTAYDTKIRYGQYFRIIDKKDMVCLLNEKEERIIELEKENVKLRNDVFEKHIFEKHWENYTDHEGYTGETTDDIRFSTEEDKIFEERTRKALERVEKSDRKPLSSKDVFLDELKNW